MARITIKDMTGSGPLGFALSSLVFLSGRWMEIRFRAHPLDGSAVLHAAIAFGLIVLTIAIFIAALRSLPLPKHNKVLVTSGPYAFVRHPRYSALVFCLYPAFALFLHSLVCLAMLPLAYLAFLAASAKEDRMLVSLFGDQYSHYMKRVPALIPGFRRQ